MGGGGGESSPCLLIAKEGGIEPLVTLLRSGGREGGLGREQGLKLRAATIRLVAILSQHPACRVAFFQTPYLIDTLFAVGINALREIERKTNNNDQQQPQHHRLLCAPSPPPSPPPQPKPTNTPPTSSPSPSGSPPWKPSTWPLPLPTWLLSATGATSVVSSN